MIEIWQEEKDEIMNLRVQDQQPSWVEDCNSDLEGTQACSSGVWFHK